MCSSAQDSHRLLLSTSVATSAHSKADLPPRTTRESPWVALGSLEAPRFLPARRVQQPHPLRARRIFRGNPGPSSYYRLSPFSKSLEHAPQVQCNTSRRTSRDICEMAV